MRPAENAFELYRLGGSIATLSEILDEVTLRKITAMQLAGQLVEVRSQLEAIVEDKFIPLDTCKQATKRLYDKIIEVMASIMRRMRHISDDDDRWAKPIDTPEIADLKEFIRAFEYVFAAEVSNASLYIVEQIGAYQTRTLIENAEVVFPRNVRDELAADAITDIRAAGRSLAFELPTAVGFHVCRAIETTLLQYFSALKIPVPEYRNLGSYIKALEKQSGEKGINLKVLATLDQFRDLHRNPIMHPEVHLTMNEAQILFALAQSAISGIVQDINRIVENIPATKNNDGFAFQDASSSDSVTRSNTK